MPCLPKMFGSYFFIVLFNDHISSVCYVTALKIGVM